MMQVNIQNHSEIFETISFENGEFSTTITSTGQING